MAYKVRDFTGEIVQGLSGIGQIGTALNDRKKADLLAKEGAARLKESEQIQLLNQQKIDAGKTAANQDAQARQISSETEARGMMAPAAMEGTKTATGNAVDFQAVKTAKQADSDAKLYNMLNQGKEGFLPLNGRALAKMKEDKALAGNQADQAEIKKEEVASAKESRAAAESKAGLGETAARTRLLGAQEKKTNADAVAGPLKPPTESQSNAALFGRRMELAMKDMESVRAGGYDPSTITAGLGRKLQKLPGGNMTASDGAQRQRNAETNFLTAVLRKESGASISPTEFTSGEELYFDRTGDSAALKEQKARNRAQAFEGLKSGAGPAWQGVTAVEQPKPIAGDTAPSGGPKAGMVEDGYRFKGGDPSDPNNWEKQ